MNILKRSGFGPSCRYNLAMQRPSVHAVEQRIAIEQIRIGLFVRLDDWMDHPFLFSSFKIRNEKQLNVLALPRFEGGHLPAWRKAIRVPLPPPRADTPPTPAAPRWTLKWRPCGGPRRRAGNSWPGSGKRFRSLREEIHQRHGHGEGVVAQPVFAKPQESLEQAQALVTESGGFLAGRERCPDSSHERQERRRGRLLPRPQRHHAFPHAGQGGGIHRQGNARPGPGHSVA
jgi:hypothetical protein